MKILSVTKALNDKADVSWEKISKLFANNSNSEQDLMKELFRYAYKDGYYSAVHDMKENADDNDSD